MIAFGGNALLRRGEKLTMENQRENARRAASAVAELLANTEFRACITHGNGPQVGLLAAQDETMGLDVLDAETEGQIGYVLELELANILQGGNEVVTLLTQTVVDPADPAFQHPTKPIGKWYDNTEEDIVHALEREKGWKFFSSENKWRRIVASPKPMSIVEAHAVSILLDAGVLVICCGGGGIPVAFEKGTTVKRYGIEAVVDKDLASAVLAADIGADMLIMLTDQDTIYDPDLWPKEKVPLPSPISYTDVQNRKFEEGSMKPKVEAACDFVQKTGGKAAIGNMKNLVDIVDGKAGTMIVPS